MERHRSEKLPVVSASSAAAESGVLGVRLARFVDDAAGVQGKPQTAAVALLVKVDGLYRAVLEAEVFVMREGRVRSRVSWA